MNGKINEEIKKIKDLAEEWKEILIVIAFIAVIVSLIGLKIYSDRKGEAKDLESSQDCHYQAIEKAQEKYGIEILGSSGCRSCQNKEGGTENYRKEDYESYYRECLINLKIER